LQSVDELSEFVETRGFAISFATYQPGNRSEYTGWPKKVSHY